MNQRPRDSLEFLRRTGGEPPTAVESQHDRFVAAPIAVEPVVSDDSGDPIELTRRQAVIAGVAVVLLSVLTFMIGFMVGENAPTEAGSAGTVRVWTIRVIEYDDTRSGEIAAQTWKAKIERLAKDEVTIERLDRDRKLLVTLGSWLKNPNQSERALRLLAWVRNLEAKGRDKKPFASAYFYPIKR